MVAPKIRVMIIDDSASVRQTLKTILEEDPELEVVFRAVFKGRVRYCLIMGFAWPIIAVATILRGGRA